MAAVPQPLQIAPEYEQRVDEFESEWRGGGIPDLPAYLTGPHSNNRDYLRSLIEVDLEYRWRGYHDDNGTPAAGDALGFPRFPRLEDYALLLPDRRADVYTLELMAEEYRVRMRWGDRPEREAYADRFPFGEAAVDTALNQVVTEFQSEGISSATNLLPEQDQSSRSVYRGTTVSYLAPDRPDRTANDRAEDGFLRMGRYRLLEILGRGGFGEVWKAEDPSLGTHVAVKVPRMDRDANALARFQEEGRKLAAMRDIDGVVTVYDVGEQDGRPYIVSKLIEGENLTARLKRDRPSHRESAELIATVAEILHRAHLKGLVHRDVKPANILIDRAGRPHLGDFGLAATEWEQLREVPSVMGTYAYMSPEQARGDSHLVDGRSDVYSLGVVFYELLTGRLPFVGKNWPQYREQILNREPRPLRTLDETIPVELEQICLRCLRRNIPDRYTSTIDLASALRQFLDDPSTPASDARESRVNRRAAMFQIGVPVAATVAAAAGWHFRPKPEVAPEVAPDPVVPPLREILWSRKSSVTWSVRNDRKSIRVGADNFGLLSTGVHQQGKLEFSVTFEQAVWDGGWGLFFGCVEESVNVVARYFAIELLQDEDTHILYATLRYNPAPLSRGRFSSQLATEVVGPLDHGPKTLAVRIEDEALIDVEFAGAKCNQLMHHRSESLRIRPEPADCRGSFGIWCISGSFVASDITANGRILRFD